MSPSTREVVARAQTGSLSVALEGRLIGAAADSGGWSFGRRIAFRAEVSVPGLLIHEFELPDPDAWTRLSAVDPVLDELIAAWDLPCQRAPLS